MILMKIVVACTMFACAVASASPYQMPNTESKILRDENTKREYELYIKLPEDYSENVNYPVIYLTDSWYTFPVVAGSVQVPMATEKMQEVIVVGISRDLSMDRDTSRLRDYTPTSPKNWKRKSGEADLYHRFISNDVFNYIDSTYSTDKNQRTYVGVSLGGLWGAYVLLTYPDTFENYVLASPALWFDDEYIFRLEQEYAKANSDLKANVYLSVGSLEVLKGEGFTLDMVIDSRRLYEALKSRQYENLTIKNAVVDSANHETAFPASSIMGLYWLFGNDS
ncbi:alpha/beta hydrolase [Marinimicrobium sp. ABcell2]|uniref:alpha/beta hydrolase n=1 Tax=Marinimicrobium sp. ABcell2 TaxID=3069751 RepID=UPI0027AE1472|nr:alpha/beta hydrolase-fold protein [Marinimicrobium sp. ABcell2]MDQ2077129.1 alpha/beta hydrolase-fold protein [Marinimicrobium sp. ABcell2]